MVCKRMIENAKRLLHREDCSCAVVSADGAELILNGQGLAPVIDLLRENPELLRGAAAADKVIGRAAAMLLAYGGVSSIWGDIMSRPALDFLRESNIEASYGTLVPVLMNRVGSGQCPMEAKAAALDSAEEAYRAFVLGSN